MGNSALDTLGRKFYPEYYEMECDNRIYQLFHDGDVFEADYYTWLTHTGVDVTRVLSPDDDMAVNFNGVLGHCDFVVRLDGIDVVVETKTASDNYFKGLKRERDKRKVIGMYGDDIPYLMNEMSDTRGHITQTALYRAALGLNEAVIVVKNKATSELLIYNIPDDTSDIINRARKVISLWNECNSWVDVASNIGIVEPMKELREKMHTGRYLVPRKMYGSPMIPLCYEYTIENGHTIVAGYRVPHGMYNELLLKLYEDIGYYFYDPENIPDMLEKYQRGE
jgi:hypothetical protein